METYEKYLINESNNNKELNETNIIGAVNTFKKAIKLIGDLIILTKVDFDDEYEIEEKSKDILNELDKILRNKSINPVYRDMIRCGVQTALKNLNYKNRLNIGY
jgi:predicted RNA binding protein with dsRBD fold (UPF0201 family)